MERLATKHPLYAIDQNYHCEKYGAQSDRKQAARERILPRTFWISVIWWLKLFGDWREA
jgi:hypothetical protein